MDYLILFVVGLIVSFAQNIAGGGGAIIFLPVLIGLGLSPIDAIGTNMLAAVGIVLGSAFSPKARGIVRREYIWPMIGIVTVASFVGPAISLHLGQSTVKTISGMLIITTAIISLLTWKMPSHSRKVSQTSRYSGYGLYFITSTLLAGFASGIGLISNYVLVGLVGMSTLETIATRRIAGLVGVTIQLAIFSVHGHVHWEYGAVLAISSFIGSYYGINYAIKKGNPFVKKAMAVTAILLVLLLFI